MHNWMALDPAKADYGSTHGATVNGFTLLQLPCGRIFTVTGVCSCASREDAERHAMRAHKSDADRRVSRKTLLSWRLP